PPPSHTHTLSIATQQPPRASLFPYTTLFRSGGGRRRLFPRAPGSHGAAAAAVARAAKAASLVHLRRPDSGLTPRRVFAAVRILADRKSTRLNSSHVKISYAVFCLKKKTAG